VSKSTSTMHVLSILFSHPSIASAMIDSFLMRGDHKFPDIGCLLGDLVSNGRRFRLGQDCATLTYPCCDRVFAQ
jgi:hypothetical protein